MNTAVLLLLVFLSSVLATGLVRYYALSRNIMDVPNPRSSHSAPTPRGGGLAIVGVSLSAIVYLLWRGQLPPEVFVALAGGGLLVAAAGFIDDLRDVPPQWRIAAHFAAVAWALWWLGGFPPLQIGDAVYDPGWLWQVIGAVLLVWLINLYNFMDGIDAIAGAEFVTVVGSAIILLWLIGSTGDWMILTMTVLTFVVLGFLVWNWPPAKIFMGDVGSGFLGFVIGVLLVVSSHESPLSIWVWLILLALFLMDATITLLRRMLRRERWYSAHRSHAYQWLSRRWNSHAVVTVGLIAVNLLWLLPAAYFAMHEPGKAWIITLVCFGVLVPLLLALGAGRRELTS